MEISLNLQNLDEILQFIPDDGILLLCGNLASGKTTLTKKIVEKKYPKFLNQVNSPTFSIMQNYGQIYHYDIYNCGFSGILKNGLIENLFEEGLHIIEWADENLEKFLKKNYLNYTKVSIFLSQNSRIYRIENV